MKLSHILAMVAAGAASPAAPAQQAPAPATASPAAFDRAAARDMITRLAAELESTFVFPDKARLYAQALRTKLAAGGYDAIADAATLARTVTADLQAIHPDGHLGVRPPGAEPVQPTREASPAAPVAPAPSLEVATMIAPGIAYLRYNSFFGEPDQLARLAKFLDDNVGATALILDVRTHRGGGLEEMDVLFPRLFDRPLAVMNMDLRESVFQREGPPPFRSMVRVPGPEGVVRMEHRVTPVTPASGWARTRVYVLTAGRTASAAEHLASALKGTRRATLIGDTTMGAGNFGGEAQLPGGYRAFIPAGHSLFPGGEGWEGIGVTPDIAVAPERALYEALVRERVAPAEAERLAERFKPTQSMARRRPLRPR